VKLLETTVTVSVRGDGLLERFEVVLPPDTTERLGTRPADGNETAGVESQPMFWRILPCTD